MALCRYAFIVKGPGYKAASQTAVLSSRAFHTTVVGVSNVSEAKPVAIDLVTAGVQLIELCGGFTAAEAAELQAQVGSDVLVGVVTFTPAQEAKLAKLFG